MIDFTPQGKHSKGHQNPIGLKKRRNKKRQAQKQARKIQRRYRKR